MNLSKASEFAGLAFKHIVNDFAEEIYIRTGQDFTRPVSIYATVNELCNAHCRYCIYGFPTKLNDEMTIEEWQQALMNLKRFIGPYHISLSGGEPYLKKGFVDLLQFCHDHDIKAGVVTNGSALNEKNAARTVSAQPFNVNVSVDGPTAELHDFIRGMPGLFAKLSRGIQNLVHEKAAQKIGFPIIVKPTVNKLNFRVLPELVYWAREIGASAVNFQPVECWNDTSREEFWITPDLHQELGHMIEQLIQMKAEGWPIMNPDHTLRLWLNHFAGDSAPEDNFPCRVGMRNLFINSNGSVQLCFYMAPIGNVLKESDMRKLWYSPEAAKIRKDTVECERLCLLTCLAKKTIGDKVTQGLVVIRSLLSKNQVA